MTTLEQPIVLPQSQAPGLFANHGSEWAVILTHPWGPLGGNLHNNVVARGARYFQSLGITTLRFDFVGRQFLSGGTAQAQQVQEAADFVVVASGANATKILLVGYSYGSLLAASASAAMDSCVGVVSIAPPWAVQHWLLFFQSNHHLQRSLTSKPDLPRLFVMGEKDDFTSLAVFERTLKQFPPDSTASRVIANADHFFRRREGEVMNVIGEWLLQVFPDDCRGDLKNLGNLPSS